MGTIQGAKLGMGFRTASSRRACKNCEYGKRLDSGRNPVEVEWNCEKGGFFVTAMAVCQQHMHRQRTTKVNA